MYTSDLQYWDSWMNHIINEATKPKQEHLEIKLLDVEKFVKNNPSTKEITSSVFFTRIGQPDPDGLLSNEIFGITKEERSGIYGYIDLGDYFLHPLVYKKLIRLDRKVRNIIHGTKYYSINSSGELVEDSTNGHTGIRWFKTNFDKIKWKDNDNNKRIKIVKFIKDNKNVAFMKKLLVMPAYYRDVNTEGSGKVSVGEINELYASVISNVRGIKETSEFGVDVSDNIRGRVQEGILAIYDWICGNNNDLLEGASGLSKKNGIIRRAGMAKTTDYGSRLVLSAPNLKVETSDEILVDVKHVAVPLASLVANFLPFVIYHVKRWMDNNFATAIPIITKKGKIEYREIQDYNLVYSDEVIKEEIEKFIHGYSDRFVPLTYTDPDTKEKVMFKFMGSTVIRPEKYMKDMEAGISPEESNLAGIDRYITWCDIFFMAVSEAIQDKHVVITRYPIDSMYNQFPARARISSTMETEVAYVNGKLYRWYPKIRQEDIGCNTSNMFIDTLIMSNLLLQAIGGDYDGDQVSVKGVFTKEANLECERFINSKFNYIGMDGRNIRTTTNEAVQSIFTLTMVLNPDKKKLTQPVF